MRDSTRLDQAKRGSPGPRSRRLRRRRPRVGSERGSHPGSDGRSQICAAGQALTTWLGRTPAELSRSGWGGTGFSGFARRDGEMARRTAMVSPGFASRGQVFAGGDSAPGSPTVTGTQPARRRQFPESASRDGDAARQTATVPRVRQPRRGRGSPDGDSSPSPPAETGTRLARRRQFPESASRDGDTVRRAVIVSPGSSAEARKRSPGGDSSPGLVSRGGCSSGGRLCGIRCTGQLASKRNAAASAPVAPHVRAPRQGGRDDPPIQPRGRTRQPRSDRPRHKPMGHRARTGHRKPVPRQAEISPAPA